MALWAAGMRRRRRPALKVEADKHLFSALGPLPHVANGQASARTTSAPQLRIGGGISTDTNARLDSIQLAMDYE